jgi:hypothetical protein
MKRTVIVLAAVVILAGATFTVVAADGGPLAEAGLDQEVDVNTTVQLDGTGSSHPNGTIKGYEWSIETPAGRTITPACPHCNRTHFTPRDTGRYDVTLTVTDEHGRTDRDTLYVFVEEAGPSVELTGDTEPPVGRSTRYKATARTTNAELRNLTWKLGNRTVARESLSGSQDRTDRSFSFTEPDTYRLGVIVQDSSNRTARDTLIVESHGTSGNSSDTPAIAEPGSPDGANRGEQCQRAAVVGNPTGSGTAAAVTCADGNSETVERFADETCSATMEDCELARADGQGRDQGGRDNRGIAQTTDIIPNEWTADDNTGNTDALSHVNQVGTDSGRSPNSGGSDRGRII